MNITDLSKRSQEENKIINVLFQDGTLLIYNYFPPIFASPIKSSYVDNSDLLDYSFHVDNTETFYFKTEVKYIKIIEKE